MSYDPTWPDAVIVSHPALVVWVLSLGQNVLVTQVIGPLVQDPGSTLHSNRVAAAEVGVEFRTVAVALEILTLKVFVFIEDNLQVHTRWDMGLLYNSSFVTRCAYIFHTS